MLNKSYLTNIIAALLAVFGYFYNNNIVLLIGLFALSGAITNVLAIHMLFEKVPLLYGSGVITLKFEQFKASIRALILDEFFSEEKVSRFLSEQNIGIDFKAIIKRVDLSPSFDKLVEVIETSQFGPMLAMFGGNEALQPLRDSFIEKMQDSLVELSEQETFKDIVSDELGFNNKGQGFTSTIEQAVDARLDELTPVMVKEIIQNMIKKHLGWLVVWGGVFGGTFGFITALI